jgi:hypothetical protein
LTISLRHTIPIENEYEIYSFIDWIKWDKICLNKEEGGLGVHRVKEFNLALLGKWCWRLLQETESLWFKVLASKYGIRDGQVDN